MVVADMVCGRYRFSVRSVFVLVAADIVLLWPILLQQIWFVADMVAPQVV